MVFFHLSLAFGELIGAPVTLVILETQVNGRPVAALANWLIPVPVSKALAILSFYGKSLRSSQQDHELRHGRINKQIVENLIANPAYS